MKKSINLLSILLITTLLSCTGEVISQNVNITNEVKATDIPSPIATIAPNVIKHSPILAKTPSPKVEESKLEIPKEKDYSKIVFSLQDSYYNYIKYQETISEVKVSFNSIKEQKEYYEKTTISNPKSIDYQNYYIDLPIEGNLELKEIKLDLVYLDGSKDNDYTIEIPEEFKSLIEIKNNSIFGLKTGLAYVKVTSNKNKNIFKFINIEVKSKAKFYRNHCDEMCGGTFDGKVSDPSGVPVYGAKVSAKSLEPDIKWESEEQLTGGGAYVFRNVPLYAKILITVTKEGWTTRQRTEIVKSNFEGYPLANKFDFDTIYAIQDEPEITSLKVNGVLATATGANSKPSITALASANPNISNLDNKNLEVEMTFSEPVRKDDVENFFKITLQNFSDVNKASFIIDKNFAGSSWNWSDNDRVVKFSTNKPILTNSTLQDVKCLLEFTQPFRDKDDKEAKSWKYIRFAPANSGDFLVFSIKNTSIDTKE